MGKREQKPESQSIGKIMYTDTEIIAFYRRNSFQETDSDPGATSSLIISLSLFKVIISHVLFPFTFNTISPFQLSTDGLFLISLRK